MVQDNLITQNDIDLIEGYIQGNLDESLTPVQLLRADVNNDGFLTVNDIVIIENGIECDVTDNERKATKFIIGDLDNNLVINGGDLDCMVDLFDNTGVATTFTALEHVLADVNGDCIFDQADISAFSQALLGGTLPYQDIDENLGIPSPVQAGLSNIYHRSM